MCIRDRQQIRLKGIAVDEGYPVGICRQTSHYGNVNALRALVEKTIPDRMTTPDVGDLTGGEDFIDQLGVFLSLLKILRCRRRTSVVFGGGRNI